jgi:hypothetical protein
MTTRNIRLPLTSVIACCLLSCLYISHASADMGRLVLSEQQGDSRISVFTSPDPLRAGPIDISVLLQHSETGQPIDDADVNLRIISGDGRGTIHAVATQAAATNKLLLAAVLELPSPGSWEVEINYSTHHKPASQVRFTMQASPPLPQWFAVWPWFSWPAAVVLLFGAHRWLVARKFRSTTVKRMRRRIAQRDNELVNA